MRRALFSTSIILSLAALGACGGDRSAETAAADGEAAATDAAQETSGAPAGGAGAAGGTAATPAGGATITGTVSFSGAAPANPTIDMSEEPDCQQKYSRAPEDPVVTVRDGKLANAFVYVKSGLPAGATYPAPKTPVVLDQEGCLYHPRVFGVMAGQPIEIRNSDPVLHNIKAVPKTNRGFNVSQPSEGMKTMRTFSKPETMVPLECNVHGWMHAEAGVMRHPFFAVSDSTGAFRIAGLPAGTYELEAWHEKLGTRTARVTVPEGGSATADLAFGGGTT